MKKIITLMAAVMMCTASAIAKDIKVLVVKTSPEMHCNNCENKIKGNVRFVAGVKRIDTSLSTKLVTITYDADKTKAKIIETAFKKIGYTAIVVSNGAPAQKVDGTSGATQQNKPAGTKKVDGTSGATQQKK